MRPLVLAAVVLAAGEAAGAASPVPKGVLARTVVARGTFPPLDAKDWKPFKDAEGLKFWDETEGKGDPVPAGAKVTVHYVGWLTDGTKFDSSRDADRPPSTFGLDHVIKGWQLGVVGMKPGGVRRLYIPAAMGYGERGVPPKIPGNSDLVFEIELVEFKN